MEFCAKQRPIDAEFGAFVEQWTIGDAPPSEVKRRVNPLLYQDGRHCAIPAISDERLGYVMGTNVGSSSSFTIQDLDRMAKSFPWGNGLTLHLPVEGGRSLANYTDSVVVHEQSLIGGFRIPLASFTSQLLSAMELSPARISPNSWFHFNAFAYHCVSKGFYPTYDQVCMLFQCLEIERGVFSFQCNANLIRTPRISVGWRERWFLVKQRDEYSFGFPLYSLKPKCFPKNAEWSQRKLLKNVLELPLPFELDHAEVITDDNLESAGISYPSMHPTQNVVESVVAVDNLESTEIYYPFEHPTPYVGECVVAAIPVVKKEDITVAFASKEDWMDMGEHHEILTKKRDDLSRVIDEGIDVEFGDLAKQWAIGDTLPGEVKRRVNPLMYKDGRHCAIPAISQERLGYVIGTNAGSSSSFTIQDLDRMAKYFPWGNGLTLHLPVEGGRSLANYTDSLVLHEQSLIGGFRIPLASFMSQLLSAMELSPARISPNSWLYFNAFAHHCVSKGFYPTYEQVCMLFQCLEIERGVFNFHLCNMNLTQTPSKSIGWRERWFLVKQKDEYSFGFPLYSMKPKSFPKNIKGSQRKFLKTMLELDYIKVIQVITDDKLESAGICYPFECPTQCVVERVDAASGEAKNYDAKKRKRIAAMVTPSSTQRIKNPVKNVKSVLESDKVVHVSSPSVQSLLNPQDRRRSQAVPMIQYEEVSLVQVQPVQVAFQSNRVVSKEKIRPCRIGSKTGPSSSRLKEKETVLGGVIEKLDAAMMHKVNAENQAMAEYNSRLCKMVQELSQENATLNEKLNKEAEQRQLEVHELTEENGRLRKMTTELSQDNKSLRKVLKKVKSDIASL